MGPGFHRAYAGRLAWRYRFLLATLLALLGLLHPLFALLSPLGLLVPSRLLEGRALREIARISLAYPTALAYGEERLWAEARRVPARLPPFPWGLLLAYGLALFLALGFHLARPAPLPFPSPAGAERVAPLSREDQAQDGAAGKEAAQSGAKSEGQAAPSEGEEQAAPSQGREQGAPSEAPGEGAPQAEGPSPARPKEGAPARALPGTGSPGEEAGPAEAPPREDGGGQETPPPQASRRGPNAGGALGEKEGSLTPTQAQGPEVGLLGEGEDGDKAALPSPWPGGQPPEKVRRGVEVYLEKTLLPPEARELLKRYFSP